MRWYNRFLLPLGLLLQRRLAWAPGLIDVAKVDELLLVCRRGGQGAAQHPGAGRGLSLAGEAGRERRIERRQ